MKRQLSSFQIIIGGFVLVILVGSALLMLPFATQDGKGASFLEALFTATSATCVTGLVVQDTATYWSLFGQSVILLLIQIGGMGVVTMVVLMSLIAGRRIGLKQRSTMQEAIAAPNLGGIVKLTDFIIKTTLTIEVLGALLLFPVFYKDFGFWRGLWFAAFHAISAFCNAGFDLMGEVAKYSSLTGYADNLVVNIVIMSLIVIGGIGFLTWEDVKNKGMHMKQYRMQSKVILMVTAILIVIPFLFFYVLELSGPQWQELSDGEKILTALFQTITPRTAGFNTIDLTQMSEAGQTLTMLLMLTGGAPGSTAGGMKVTTFAVLVLTMLAVFRRDADANCFGRRIPEDTVRFAATILLMYFLLFMTGGMVISVCEGLPMLTCLFETASAIGTVGLTLGITPELGLISRCVLIVLMFFGRVGCLTLVFAASSGTKINMAKLPEEKITVG
ncbi:MAG: Trk family potassium uptake protein [Lachnospiraceae bacterium]|nr:Trk family potassium uptake protein [Lachnospiraceae bacterium]